MVVHLGCFFQMFALTLRSILLLAAGFIVPPLLRPDVDAGRQRDVREAYLPWSHEEYIQFPFLVNYKRRPTPPTKAERESATEKGKRSPEEPKTVLTEEEFLSAPRIDATGVGANISLTVYDCQHASTRYLPVNAVKAGACPDPDMDYHRPITTYATLAFRAPNVRVVASHCIVRETHVVGFCHTPITFFGYWGIKQNHYRRLNQMVRLSASECREAVKTRSYFHQDPLDKQFNHPYTSRDIVLGNRLYHDYYAIGRRDETTGQCDLTGSFTQEDRNGDLEEVSQSTVWVRRTLYFSEKVGYFDQKAGAYRFGDLTVEGETKSEFFDDEMGNLAWDPVRPGCAKNHLRFYTGNVTIHRATKAIHSDILLVQSPSTQQTAGYELRKPVQFCDTACRETNHPEVIACIGASSKILNHMQNGVGVTKLTVRDADQMSALAGLHFMILQAQFTWQERFRTIVHRLCELARADINIRLRSLVGADNHLALHDYFGTGHAYLRLAQSVYVGNCPKRSVTVRPIKNCTHEIPIWYRGHALFADPDTRVIQPMGTVIPCSRATPPRFEIGESWYCATPALVPCSAPATLQPLSVHFTPESYSIGMSTGALSLEELRAHRDLLQETQAQRPIMAMATHAANAMTAEDSDDPDSTGFSWPNATSLMASLLPSAFLSSILWTVCRSGLIVFSIVLAVSIGKALIISCCRARAARAQGASWGMVFITIISGTAWAVYTIAGATVTGVASFCRFLCCGPGAPRQLPEGEPQGVELEERRPLTASAPPKETDRRSPSPPPPPQDYTVLRTTTTTTPSRPADSRRDISTFRRAQSEPLPPPPPHITGTRAQHQRHRRQESIVSFGRPLETLHERDTPSEHSSDEDPEGRRKRPDSLHLYPDLKDASVDLPEEMPSYTKMGRFLGYVDNTLKRRSKKRKAEGKVGQGQAFPSPRAPRLEAETAEVERFVQQTQPLPEQQGLLAGHEPLMGLPVINTTVAPTMAHGVLRFTEPLVAEAGGPSGERPKAKAPPPPKRADQ